MESAVGLSLETSKVESAVRNQARAKLNQLVHSRSDEPAGTRIEKLAGEEEDELSTVDESVSSSDYKSVSGALCILYVQEQRAIAAQVCIGSAKISKAFIKSAVAYLFDPYYRTNKWYQSRLFLNEH
ncbi:hypothetical protein F511_20423 [Dorcoceras hygrometricum]|uniref:Uncharacterized protein n=1 Tax=Dorcoceras hygrometricum TaxID=472368 RepID=A0A2Z7AYY7_9LAMI|nr:hypothetical protein F511_20423 [Dorcoceras hygrometricum]